jgi:hypothetical protein
MITIQLWIQKPGYVTTLPLKEISLRDLEQRGGGDAKEVTHTHHCRGRNSGYLERRKSSVSHVASCSE